MADPIILTALQIDKLYGKVENSTDTFSIDSTNMEGTVAVTRNNSTRFLIDKNGNQFDLNIYTIPTNPGA